MNSPSTAGADEVAVSRRILILFAHPALEKSRVNRRLIAAVRNLPGVTLHDLYEAYPDFHVRVEREQELLMDHDVVVMQHPFFWYSTPALLKDTGDMGTLFSDDGPDISGVAATSDAVRELLQRLERERRTGTLSLRLSKGKSIITYCLGRVMHAEHPDGQGLRALERILRSPTAKYKFSRELEPREEALNLWVSDYLRSRNMDPSQATQKFQPQRQPRR